MGALKERCEHLASFLFDAFQNFDVQHMPYGIYAFDGVRRSYRYGFKRETSDRIISPAMNRYGCLTKHSSVKWPKHQCDSVDFITPQGDLGSLDFHRISFIRVSPFGNAYHVDKSVDHKQRWEELALTSRIRQLSRVDSVTTGIPMQLVMLVGFDKEPTPLGVELRQLQNELGASLEALSFFDRIWPDASERGFYIRACIWAKLQSEHDTRS